eukprot:754973-Hanusia_phi.AAC.7
MIVTSLSSWNVRVLRTHGLADIHSLNVPHSPAAVICFPLFHISFSCLTVGQDEEMEKLSAVVRHLEHLKMSLQDDPASTTQDFANFQTSSFWS